MIESPALSIDGYRINVSNWNEGCPLSIALDADVRNHGNRPTSQIDLYLHSELVLESAVGEAGTKLAVRIATVESLWSYDRKLTQVSICLDRPLDPGETTTIQLHYRGTFSPSSLRSPSDFMRIDSTGTFLRGLAYSLWFPAINPEAIDATAGFEIWIDVPIGWTGIAVGRLKTTSSNASRTMFHWGTDVPIKLLQMQLFAGRFECVSQDQVAVYFREGHILAARFLAAECSRLLSFYTANYGIPETQPNFIILETCPFGNISSGNAIGLTPEVFDQASEGHLTYERYDLIAHELVHTFVIPRIQDKTQGAALLLEGFPSYFHVPALTTLLGEDYRRWFLGKVWKSYRSMVRRRQEAADKSSTLRNIPLEDIGIEEIPAYKDRFLLSDKLPIVLDRLQALVGSSTFFAACREFFSHGSERPVSFSRFIAILEAHSGQDLSAFRKRWFQSTDDLPDEWFPLRTGDNE